MKLTTAGTTRITDTAAHLAGICIVGLLTLLASIPAAAATATTTFAVTATVQATCTVSATAMAFANYAGVVAPSTSTVSVTCTNTTPYTVGLDAGTATGATVTNRSMKSGAVLLGYGLFSDSAHSANFATTTSLTGNGASQPITIYGQIPEGQYVTPGAYTDTITVTVTY
jgi:spore coat protein U-like protein